jgi:hypothetical protein
MRRCVEAAFSGRNPAPAVPVAIIQACQALVMGGAETCRLVALTVTAATAVDPAVPPNIIQAGAGGRDFRSLYKEAVYQVLLAEAAARSAPWQPSRDPFVSNPYREPTIDLDWVKRRNNKLAGAADLLLVVEHVAAVPADAAAVLNTLARYEIALLDRAAVTYHIPPRLSTAVTIDLLQRWLAGDAGGRRHQGLAVALLRFAGPSLRDGWDAVESHHVNDPAPYDALCRTAAAICAVGEVKAQTVLIDHLRQLAREMDAHQARRGYLFTRSVWLPPEASPESAVLIAFLRDQDALGRRIAILDVMDAARFWLPLLDGRDDALPSFVRMLTAELDSHAVAEDRRALAQLLDRL